GPEDLLENLIRSGYPWHILGSRLKEIDRQFKSVTEEYAEIHDSITQLSDQVSDIRERQNDAADTVRKVLRDEANSLQNRWLIGSGSIVLGFLGIILSASANPAIWQFAKDQGVFLGLAFIAAAVVALWTISRHK